MGIVSLAKAEEKRLIKNKYFCSGTSFPEQFICRSLTQIFPKTENRIKDPMMQMEYDINVPEINLYIEYNGYIFHNTEEKLKRDEIKRLHCKMQGITFIQIIEGPEISEITKEIDDNTIQYKINGNCAIKTIISNLMIIIGDIITMYQLPEQIVDYQRSFYEAMLLSNKYQYLIKYDTLGGVAGKEYKNEVYCDHKIIIDDLGHRVLSLT